jgi:hypothetical protein
MLDCDKCETAVSSALVSDEQLSVNQAYASDGAGEWTLASKTIKGLENSK